MRWGNGVRPAGPRGGFPPLRLGAFLAIALGIGGVLVVAAPVPFSFAELPGGAPPAKDMPPRCLALSYSGPGEHAWLPDTLVLTPVRLIPELPWHRAIPGRIDWGWKPAGPDSIDVSGHHGPQFRLPAAGDTLVGRAGWPYYESLWVALRADRWTVRAVPFPCPPGADRGSA